MSRLVRSNGLQFSESLQFRCAIPRFLLALAGGCLAFVLLCAPPAQAQVSAAISGRVTDPAGATVSGAEVTAKNVETGETRSTVTDAAGHYWVPSLAVGEYEVRVTKQGFQEQVRERDSSGRRTGGQRGHGTEARPDHRAGQGDRGCSR